jgi:hypothetical protein
MFTPVRFNLNGTVKAVPSSTIQRHRVVRPLASLSLPLSPTIYSQEAKTLTSEKKTAPGSHASILLSPIPSPSRRLPPLPGHRLPPIPGRCSCIIHQPPPPRSISCEVDGCGEAWRLQLLTASPAPAGPPRGFPMASSAGSGCSWPAISAHSSPAGASPVRSAASPSARCRRLAKMQLPTSLGSASASLQRIVGCLASPPSK